MKPLYIRQQQTVADPLQSERLLKALTIILEHQEDSNGSRTYARVSTSQQQHEGTIESQRRALKHHIQHHGWSLLPEHEYIDDGISGARLDRPALDRLRDATRRGEFDAVVILSPDRLARNYAHQWLLIEEFEKMNTPLIFLQNPFGDSPQGKLLTQMQGMIAEYERAQIAERTRRGRLEKPGTASSCRGRTRVMATAICRNGTAARPR